MALLPQVGLALNVMTEPSQSTSCTQEERFVYHAAAARLCVQLQQPDCVPLQPSQWPSSQGLRPHSCMLDSTLALLWACVWGQNQLCLHLPGDGLLCLTGSDSIPNQLVAWGSDAVLPQATALWAQPCHNDHSCA